ALRRAGRASKERSTARLRPVAACATTISSASPTAGSKEEGVGRVVRLIPIGVAEPVKEGLERLLVGGRHLDANQYAAVVVALVAVMEQADVPFGAHGTQKRHERAGALGKLEAEQHFVFGQLRLAAHHVAQVGLGHFVAGEVERIETLAAKACGQFFDLGLGADL